MSHEELKTRESSPKQTEAQTEGSKTEMSSVGSSEAHIEIDSCTVDLIRRFIYKNKKENQTIQINLAINVISTDKIILGTECDTFAYAMTQFRKNDVPIEWYISSYMIDRMTIQPGDLLYYEETIRTLNDVYEKLFELATQVRLLKITVKVYSCSEERQKICKNLARIGHTQVICISDSEKFEFSESDEPE